MGLTIVIPIIRFNQYSHAMMHKVARIEKKYENLHFLFAVSNDEIATELATILNGMVNSYKAHIANTYSSNALRSCAKLAETEYVYFHDCDDYADYDYLNDFCRDMPDSDEIICFNVHKYVYDENGNIVQEYDIFKNKDGQITNICNLPTCVYSKIIPRKYLDYVDFPNLPYTQDWAISYQLYLLAPHRFINYSTYYYNNYPTSSSASVHDTKYRVKRVAAYSRMLIHQMEERGKMFEADFLRAKYNDAVFYRFLHIGILVKPYIPSFRLLFRTTNMGRMSVLYQFVRKIINIIRKFLTNERIG